MYLTQHPDYEKEFGLCHASVRADTGDWLEGTTGEDLAYVTPKDFPECKLSSERRIAIVHHLVHLRIDLIGIIIESQPPALLEPMADRGPAYDYSSRQGRPSI
ncbi:hypothetical protein MAP00_008954 [Monascus purpureus]|nr:hypothetical protein MAP00_008954 [Monascus purpureus]